MKYLKTGGGKAGLKSEIEKSDARSDTNGGNRAEGIVGCKISTLERKTLQPMHYKVAKQLYF